MLPHFDEYIVKNKVLMLALKKVPKAFTEVTENENNEKVLIGSSVLLSIKKN